MTILLEKKVTEFPRDDLRAVPVKCKKLNEVFKGAPMLYFMRYS